MPRLNIRGVLPLGPLTCHHGVILRLTENFANFHLLIRELFFFFWSRRRLFLAFWSFLAIEAERTMPLEYFGYLVHIAWLIERLEPAEIRRWSDPLSHGASSLWRLLTCPHFFLCLNKKLRQKPSFHLECIETNTLKFRNYNGNINKELGWYEN